MAWLATMAPYATTALSVGQAIGEGQAQKKIAKIKADQLRTQGIADKAEAVQTAKHERKRAELLQSRVRALA